MSWFDTLFSSGQGEGAHDLYNGYANSIGTYGNYLDQIRNQMAPYMQQGMNAGNDTYGMGTNMMNQFDAMSGKGQPGGWMSAYTASPYAQYQTSLGDQTMNAQNASSGMIGSSDAMRNMSTLNQGIASGDRQNYYNDMMGLQQGAQNSFNPLMQMGYGANSQLGFDTMNTGQLIGNAQQNEGMASAYGADANAASINNALGMGIGILGGPAMSGGNSSSGGLAGLGSGLAGGGFSNLQNGGASSYGGGGGGGPAGGSGSGMNLMSLLSLIEMM